MMNTVEMICGTAAGMIGIVSLLTAIKASPKAKRRHFTFYGAGMLFFGLGVMLEETFPHRPTLSWVKHLSVVIGCILIGISLRERERILK